MNKLSNQDLVWKLVQAERRRQDQLVAAGKLPFNCADTRTGDLLKLPVLGEEFGEVCKEVYELAAFFGRPQDVTAKLLTELIQLTAVSVAWAEALVSESDGSDKANGSDESDPMKLAQALLKDGELQRVPAYVVGQLKQRLENFNRAKNEWKA